MNVQCKVRITKDIEGILPQYRPRVGRIYQAEYIDSSKDYRKFNPVCIIPISGKRIIVRHDEFEIVG